MNWGWRKLGAGTGHDDLVRELNKNMLALTHELKALRAFQHGTGDAGIAVVARIDPVAGAGLGVNVAAVDYTAVAVGGSFTSGGASTVALGTRLAVALTAHSGDTSYHAQVAITGSITTAGNVDTVAGLRIEEPVVTVGSGAVTNAATLHVVSAPTEATNNYALWVDAGAVRIDQGVALGGGSSATLGTIGGSGPSTAGQAQWLQVNIGGTNHWIPAWT